MTSIYNASNIPGLWVTATLQREAVRDAPDFAPPTAVQRAFWDKTRVQQQQEFREAGAYAVDQLREVVVSSGAEQVVLVVNDGEDGVPYLRAHLRFANNLALEIGYNETSRAQYGVENVYVYVYAIIDGQAHVLRDWDERYESGCPADIGGPMLESDRYARCVYVRDVREVVASVRSAPRYLPPEGSS